MAPERIPLDTEDKPHKKPFITTADHIRDQQDKSKMPWPDSEERSQKKEKKRSEKGRERSRKQRSTQRSGRKQRATRNQQPAKQDDGKDPEDVERKAMQKVIRQLKKNGMSDEFIEENMDSIRERVRNELR